MPLPHPLIKSNPLLLMVAEEVSEWENCLSTPSSNQSIPTYVWLPDHPIDPY